MNRITLTRETCCDLIAEKGAKLDHCDPSYRHGTYDTWVVPIGDSHYQFTVANHTTEGWDSFDTLQALEVTCVEVTTQVWVPVESPKDINHEN